jgi:hypothetical protein
MQFNLHQAAADTLRKAQKINPEVTAISYRVDVASDRDYYLWDGYVYINNSLSYMSGCNETFAGCQQNILSKLEGDVEVTFNPEKE